MVASRALTVVWLLAATGALGAGEAVGPTQGLPLGSKAGDAGPGQLTPAARTGAPDAVGPVTLELPPVEPEVPRSEPPDLAAAELDLGWSLVRTLVVLGLVVAIAYLTLNVGLRKLLGLAPMGARKGLVSVIERVALDQKRALYVIKAGDELLLLGSADQTLSLITRLDAKHLEGLASASPPNPTAPLMSPFLQKLLGRKDAPPPPSSVP
jgi:flagellar protein FliO/FliZ